MSPIAPVPKSHQPRQLNGAYAGENGRAAAGPSQRSQSIVSGTLCAAVGRLIACGAEPVEAGYHIYERESFGRMKLLQHFLSSLRLECGGRVCVGILPLGIFEQTGTTAEDTEGLVDYARAIDGVDIGVLLEERAGMTKGSLRGKDPSLRLDRVAAQFGGGGHACAAGLNPKEPLAVVQPRLLAALAETLARVAALKSR